ncbi:molybdopterin-dependent oxidoreductase [Pilimelia columellifera]|uniref:Sulfite oxidase n=1 Tax=Pilimelia columellifera subsp. columellifera TaxID=706583 RepID=A0ABN3NHE4_9ACTN
MRRDHRPAVAGVLAAAAGLAVGELVAALSRPQSGPVVAVGGAVIDATPTPVKEWAVATFGMWDKPLLLSGIGLVVVGYAAAAGMLAARRHQLGYAAVVLFGLVAAGAAASRPDARWTDPAPSALAAVVAGVALTLALRPLRPPPDPRRRQFLVAAAAVGGVAVATGGLAATLRSTGRQAAERLRAAVRLPAPADPARPLPAGVGPGFHTANADFYRVDTALTVPRLDPERWRLRITGMVGRPRELTFAELLGRPLTERDITLNCVSNEVGGPYVGTARWLGVPVAALLREAGVLAGADQLITRSTEGMTIGTPLTTILDGRDALLAVAMNGEALPFANGFPARMITPGVYGYVGACKWVTELEVTTFAEVDAYWVKRDWAAQAPVKTASRIDRPAPFARLAAGPTTIAGVAWAQRRGISAVRVQIDQGPWQEAELLPVPSIDTWVQWRLPWAASPGSHTLRVQAVDARGDAQTAARARPFPDGATGWHTVVVTVT